jgi:hypothetical protein
VIASGRAHVLSAIMMKPEGELLPRAEPVDETTELLVGREPVTRAGIWQIEKFGVFISICSDRRMMLEQDDFGFLPEPVCDPLERSTQAERRRDDG